MRVRIDILREQASGARTQRSREKDVDVVAIGRSTSSEVCLSDLTVGTHHAEIHRRDDGIFLVPLGSHSTRVNGRSVSSPRQLRVGDEIHLGAQKIAVVQPEGEEDLRLQIEEKASQAETTEDVAARLGIATSGTWLRPRRLSWLAVLGVLIPLLVVPMAAGIGQWTWDSGRISRPHAFFANDCRRCHAVGFQRVQDDECLSCHAGIAHHAPEATRPASLAETRCASCHAEHNGFGGLAILEERQCAECHRNLHANVPGVQVADASNFGLDHPEFTLALLEAGSGAVERVPWSADLTERSGLSFNHWRHVGQVVRDLETGDKRGVACGECHRVDAAGGGMEPIAFERHCQSCHALTFDENHPEEQAVHGDPEVMRTQIGRFYAALALAGEVQDPKAPEVLRYRAPGRQLDERGQRAARAWAGERTRAAEHFLMVDPGPCATCHAVEQTSGGAYDVAPVEVAAVWMPGARFRHASHAPFACRDCHAAAAVYDPEFEREGPRPDWSVPGPGRPYALFDSPAALAREHGLEPSEEASDVLVPGIASCRGCHGGARAGPPQVASDCVLCHAFHRDELGPLRPPQRDRGTQARTLVWPGDDDGA